MTSMGPYEMICETRAVFAQMPKDTLHLSLRHQQLWQWDSIYLTPLEWKPGWFNSPCKYFPFFCPCCMAHDFLDHLPDSCLTLQTVQSPTSNHPQSLMWLWPVFLKLLTPSLMLLQRHAIINNLGHTQLFLLPSLTHFTKQSHPIEHRAISNWRVLPFSQVRR